MDKVLLFKHFIETAFDGGEYTTDDVIAFVLLLFKEVLSFHEENKVSPFEKEETLFVNNNILDIDEHFAHPPRNEQDQVELLLNEISARSLNITKTIKVDADSESGIHNIQNRQLQLNINDPILFPVYLPGYKCYELYVGHHDDLTDIFCLGLIMASMALGLNLYDEEDLKLFVEQRANPALFRPRLHPTVCALIKEMTELDRRKRAQDLYDIIQRLENYREFDTEKQIDLSKVAGWKTKEIINKEHFILNKLRNRLFDTSRRNRLLYYKPNMRFVNLTVSSVPLVLHYQSIRPELLFTWNTEISGKVRGMKDIVLNKYLRFDDHPYLPSSLDKIKGEAQHDIQEYGFSQLKLVIAFLNWHNLKENQEERIQSPLLVIPVELKKNKKLKEDHYVVKILANEAEVNPVLSNYLRELYDIKLPDYIDLDDTTVESFFHTVKEQMEHANQGIALNYVDKPKIKLIYSVAKQTVTNYKKRQRKYTGFSSYKNLSYSYQQENYKPLGLEIFRQRIEPKASIFELLVDEDVKLSSSQLTDGSKERQLYELAESESNPYSWEFDVCNMVLGNFNYKKMSLVRDYNQVIDNNIKHSVFDHLFSDQPKTFAEADYDLDNPDNWYHVLTADPTQTKAVLYSRSGDSYIIQGPPGTGKSQTITNLIADYAARGKSVLFVCEKRAALDVVYYRLKQQGLDELCCYIHDSQSDKREFIKNLKQTYEHFTQERLDLKKIEEERNYLLQKLNKQLALLKNYHFTNTYSPEAAGVEVRRLIERLIELKKNRIGLKTTEEELLPHYKEWKVFGETVERLSKILESTGSEPYFSEHPFSKIKDSIFLTDSPINLLDRLISGSEHLLKEISSALAGLQIPEQFIERYGQMVNLIEDAVLLHPLAEGNNIKLIDLENPDSQKFEKAFQAYKDLQRQLNEAEGKNTHWKNKFSESDTTNALAIAQKNEHSVFSFFNSNWRKLKKELNSAYDFAAHAVRSSYTSILEQLQKEHELSAAINRSKLQLEQAYKIQHIDIAYQAIERVRAKSGDREVVYLLSHPEADKLVRNLYKLHNSIRELDLQLKQVLFGYDQKLISEIHDDLDTIGANLGNLHELLPVLKDYAQLPASIKKLLRHVPLHAGNMEAIIANKTLGQIYLNNKEFENTDWVSIEHAVREIENIIKQLHKLNALCIRAKIRDKFLRHLELSNKALSQLNNEQKAFKKEYAEGRKILENEFGKTMRYKSIRILAAKESGVVLKDLKPVWLMSPLSVSDSLPVDFSFFDVIIFDEASQIPLEEGVPSLYRAPQTIIVGDDKQMPPTNFFSARTEDPDDLDGLANTDDDILSNDVDSLLIQGSRKLNSVMLGWHYRSRYETLISYSNHAFYEGDLLTIPDKTIHQGNKTTIDVSSPEDAELNADHLFDRSISYHFLTNSIYENRTNIDEAKYIARLVVSLLKRKIKESIGIVAFSQEQQHAIEDALTDLAKEDKNMEQLLEEAYNRTEEDQFTGLFVKNLENVQGDERDMIIMSVCYGFDARKKMIMNFGPINKKGGEKRLNVIFSRAKKHMAVVSSIKHHYITNDYNEGANYFKQFLNYAELVSTGNMALARTILDKLVLRKNMDDEILKGNVVRQQIRAMLEKEGYEVAENIGQSNFKCSLAIKAKPQDSSYALGILLDDDLHYSNQNILEQYYQRPAILKDFGWQMIFVFVKDWLHDPEKVIAAIKKALQESLTNKDNQEDKESINTSRSEIDYSKLAASLSVDAKSDYDALSFKRLICNEEGISKFWEIAIDQQRVVVRSGRVGTKGQTIVKRFPNIEAAEMESEKMLKEKLAKGYTEDWGD